MPAPPRDVVVVIPAYDEADRIAATVAAAAALPAVSRVIVVDDGSRDGTAARATDVGAHVVTHRRRRGKGAALATGAAAAAELGDRDAGLLFLDADLGGTATGAAALIPPVLGGDADLTIGLLPQQPGAGGHGFVVRLARDGIVQSTGWTPTQPLSGQRCITRTTFESCLPLARGFGVEVGMTIDALRAGGKVLEVPVDLGHRVSDNSLRGHLHRGRQYRDVRLALWARRRQSAHTSR